MKIKLLAVVSDLHCGSEVGLSPRRFKLRRGNWVDIGDNLHQQWLADQWDSCCARLLELAGKDRFGLVVNGDATEGVHHRNEKELVAAEADKHIAMATTCLLPLSRRAEKTFVVKGTECHTEQMENQLAKDLHAEAGEARDKWLLDVHGCLVDATHHMGVTGRAYLEASAMSITMGNARLNYARAGYRIPNVFLRAHRHCGGWFSDGRGLLAVTGAWQFLTRHGHKVVPDSLPQPSIILLDWRRRNVGQLPEVHEFQAKIPQPEIAYA